MSDPFDPDEQERREEQAKKDAKLRAYHEAEDFKWIMGDARGRRFVWGLLERAGLFSLPYDGTGESAIRAIETTNEARHVMGMIFAYGPGWFTQMILDRENDNGNDERNDRN